VCRVVIQWDPAYATAFQIQLSNDAADWTTAYSITTGTGGTQTLNISGSGRYLRVYGTARATGYGYSIIEFQAYTVGGVTAPPTTPPTTPAPGNCAWVNSTAPIATRVSEVLGQMTLQQKVSILHGTDETNYIGVVKGIPALCIPDINFEDGPSGVGDGLGGVTQMPDGEASAATFGEDPYLAGQMVTADVKGIQGQGVMAEVKHAAAYNIEQPAGTIIVDGRTLQEIYLPAFQTAIEQGGAAAIMCAYSNVNNVPSCQNPNILDVPLYQQAGFQGFVTSGWGAIHSTVDSANAGLTVEMPAGYYYADFFVQAVQNGQVSQATVDTMVTRVFTEMFRFGMFDRAPSGSNTAVVTSPAHQQVALKGVEEGTVTSSGTYTPFVGIQQRLAGTGATVTYNDGTNQASAVALAQSSNVAIVFASDNYGHEEADNASLNLPNSQDALIAAVAAANPRTIVVLNDNSAILMPWLNQVAGVFEGFYDGQEYGQGIAALLFGDVNPSGKLPLTFPASLSQVPANTAAQWPGTNGQVQYSEGLDVGYRSPRANRPTSSRDSSGSR
jgi:beta-glucosidase